MRSKQSWNPVNPFMGTEYEWDEEPPMTKLWVMEDNSQTIVTENKSPDIPFQFGLNPYRGCTHACSYCYARRTHEYLSLGAGSDFETRIMAKFRAPELLRKHLCRPSWKGKTIVMSGITDCYQPLEGKYKITRGCLEVCAEYQQPIGIITRSPLIIRDIDVLCELSTKKAVRVMMSIPLLDRELCRTLEPGAPSPKSRLRAIEKLSAAGIDVGVSVSPLLPGINDSAIPETLIAARNAGARFAMIQMLRLPGSVLDVFLHTLKSAVSVEKYEKICLSISRMREGKMNQNKFGKRAVGSGVEWKLALRLFQIWKNKLGYEQVFPLDQPSPFRRPGEKVQLSLF